MSYAAIVSRISVRPHPNADRLQLGLVHGNQVVVGLDTKDGDLGVFFPTDGKLSHEMCANNDLYSKSAMDRLGMKYPDNHKFGFFDQRGKVRAQRFRGEKSDGFWCPVSHLAWAGDVSLKEGDTFTELNGHEVCRKYYTPATLRAMARGQKVPRRDAKCFPKHDDTTQFRFVADNIPDDAVIYITEKLHGTSGRFGHVMDDKTLSLMKRLANKVVPIFPEQDWTYLNGSRNVILEKTTGEGYYGTNDFRYDVVKDLQLHKGEVLYFEIVGFVNGATPIMQAQDVESTGLKDIKERYGPKMAYTYGCPEGEHRLYVYKITQVNEDGVLFELPWPQVRRRCRELGLQTVPQLIDGPLTLDVCQAAAQMEGYNVTQYEALRILVDSLMDGPSTLDERHIREGVVVRVESSYGTQYLKAKSNTFGILEGYLKEKDDFVDLEEAA